jgi:hypothetical protein
MSSIAPPEDLQALNESLALGPIFASLIRCTEMDEETFREAIPTYYQSGKVFRNFQAHRGLAVGDLKYDWQVFTNKALRILKKNAGEVAHHHTCRVGIRFDNASNNPRILVAHCIVH